jgi:acetyl-CoA carboxylase biotin carboxyl carrier protein
MNFVNSLFRKSRTQVVWKKINLEEVCAVSEITAPMGGKIIDVKVKPGDAVNEGDEVVILEAMKMELPVVASESGTVKEVKCNSGDAVEADTVLLVLE